MSRLLTIVLLSSCAGQPMPAPGWPEAEYNLGTFRTGPSSTICAYRHPADGSMISVELTKDECARITLESMRAPAQPDFTSAVPPGEAERVDQAASIDTDNGGAAAPAPSSEFDEAMDRYREPRQPAGRARDDAVGRGLERPPIRSACYGSEEEAIDAWVEYSLEHNRRAGWMPPAGDYISMFYHHLCAEEK
ncbi:MAG: hypothetical protein F4Y34_08255 [Gammaproteobacteria bacterium]|nr:hypothetical protein [Gammaproteobacteria bacterium]